MTKRTDKFSPSNIVPLDYRYVLGFYNGSGAGLWPINNDLVMALRRDRKNDFANIHGGNYDCDICGASYNEGEVWEHNETKELITLGHICARTYDLFANDATFEKEKAASIRARKLAAKRQQLLDDIQGVYDDNEGLKEAFETDHHIVSNIQSQLEQWGNLSAGQIALVFKIQKQVEERVEENWVAAPVTGERQTITGTVVHARWEQQYFGYNETSTLKGLIVVETPDGGKWKAWGSIPTSVQDQVMDHLGDEYSSADGGVAVAIKGMTITFTAKFKASDKDPEMTFYSRPTKGKLLEAQNA